jgi:general secretion pathway protein K
MKITTRQKSKDGIAIVIVLVSVFVLASLAGILAYSMKVEAKLATNNYDANDLEWLCRSGVDYARNALSLHKQNNKQQYDSLRQMWAGGEGDTNDALTDFPLKDVELGKGKFTVEITDTDRKFNINSVLNPQNEQILQKALISIGVDAADVPTIIASIEDWIDADSDMRVNGAENEYYKGLDPSYLAKNGPIDDISELLFIKGITPDIYWGPNSPQHPAVALPARAKDMTRSGLLPTAPTSSAGLVDLFTPFSSGRINILTASKDQLQVLPMVDDKIADEIIQARDQGTDEFGNMTYRSPVDLLNNTALGRPLAQQVANFCTFRSTAFEVKVTAELGQSKRVCHALLIVNTPKDIQIASFYWD